MLSIPMIAEMIGEAFFAVADMIFVSRVSVNAMATVALTEAPLMIIYSLAVGLSMAATAIVARRIGEKDPERASNAAFHAIILAIVVGIGLGVPGFIFAEEVLEIIGGDASLIAEGVGYTRIMYAANPVIILIFLLNGVFRGAGNAAIAMRALLLANLCNIALDPLFIFGLGPIPGMGVEGAAVATTIGRSIGVTYQLYHLLKGSQQVRILRKNMVLKAEIIIEYLRIGIAGFLQYFVETASWIVLVRIVSEFGKEAVAGYQMAFRTIIFTLLPSWGMASAAATLVGQNLGANQPDRAEKSAWITAKINTFFLIGVSIIFFAFSRDILILLFNQEGVVLEMAVMALRIICFGYLFFAYGMVLGQSFNGAGDTMTPMLISIFSFLMIEIPLAYWLAFEVGWDSNGVFASIAIAHSIYAMIAMYLFKKGKWKTTKV